MFQDTIQTCPLPKTWVSFVDQGSSVLGARVEPEALVKTIKCLVWLIPAPDRAGFSGWLARVFFCLCPSDQAGQTWVVSSVQSLNNHWHLGGPRLLIVFTGGPGVESISFLLREARSICQSQSASEVGKKFKGPVDHLIMSSH